MQKYKRLALVVFALLSFTLMFVYRQKYSKLSLVFEMMNAFQFRDSDTKYNEKLFEFKKTLKIDFGVHEQIAGIPYWTEIFPDIYVYSSFWMNNKSRSLLFTRNTQITTLWKMKCKMHYKNNYDDSQKTNIILLDKQGSGMFLFFECIPFDNKVPHSITFVHENLISSVSLPIISGDSYIGKYTMCIQPLPPAFNNVNKILEFIIYHSQMGVQLFIFYEAGLSLNVRRLLMELTVKDNIHALLLPWNVPFGTQTEFSTQELYFLDCFHRVVAKNYSDFALKLRLSDFVVSKEFQFNLYKYIQAYDSSVDVFQLDEKVFCEEYPSDLIAHNLFMPFVTMLKTRALDNKGNIKSVVYDVKKLNETLSNSKEFHSWFQKKGTQKAHFIPKDLALIYSYYKCGASSNDLDNFSADRSMWQYKRHFFQISSLFAG